MKIYTLLILTLLASTPCIGQTDKILISELAGPCKPNSILIVKTHGMNVIVTSHTKDELLIHENSPLTPQQAEEQNQEKLCNKKPEVVVTKKINQTTGQEVIELENISTSSVVTCYKIFVPTSTAACFIETVSGTIIVYNLNGQVNAATEGSKVILYNIKGLACITNKGGKTYLLNCAALGKTNCKGGMTWFNGAESIAHERFLAAVSGEPEKPFEMPKSFTPPAPTVAAHPRPSNLPTKSESLIGHYGAKIIGYLTGSNKN